MNDIPSCLYTVVFAIYVFAAGIMANRKSHAGKPFVFFTAFLVLESACFALELLMSHPSTPLKALWLGLRMSGALLVAPCLWLALREIVLGERPAIASLGRYALGGIVLGALLTLPLIVTAHGGTGYYNPTRALSVAHTRFIHGTMLATIFIFAVQAPWYLWRCRMLLIEQQDLENPGARRERQSFTWLHLPLAIVCTTWVLGVLRTVYCATFGSRQDLVPFFALVESSIAIGAIYLTVHRASTPEARAPLAPASATAEPVEPAAPVRAESKYAKSSLDSVLRERIKTKLARAMSADRMYCDSLLSLRSLSSAIKENAHYVSQVMNQDLNTTFYEFVNQHRIARAKELLRENSQQNVLEIAFAVGFNSKSTFNTAFRRETGTTPSEFRASATTKAEAAKVATA
jgi:AraC-like DNA-binding protein